VGRCSQRCVLDRGILNGRLQLLRALRSRARRFHLDTLRLDMFRAATLRRALCLHSDALRRDFLYRGFLYRFILRRRGFYRGVLPAAGLCRNGPVSGRIRFRLIRMRLHRFRLRDGRLRSCSVGGAKLSTRLQRFLLLPLCGSGTENLFNG